MNSSWACDEENYRVLVVGDLGKARLLDCRMGAPGTSQHAFERQAPTQDPLKMRQNESVTKFKATERYQRSEARDDKWRIVKDWFKAHKISKIDPNYVNSVKYSHAARIYVTGTSYGEVSMWDWKDCMPLGTLNALTFDCPKMVAYLARHKPRAHGEARGLGVDVLNEQGSVDDDFFDRRDLEFIKADIAAIEADKEQVRQI